MQEAIYRILMTISDSVNTGITIISVVAGVISIAELFLGWKKGEKHAVFVWGSVIIVAIAVICMTITRRNLTEVPDVVGKTYQDACNILSNHELNYTLVVDNGLYVMEQNPVAGTVIEKGTKVELMTEPIGNNAEVKARWEADKNVEYGTLAVTFKNEEIKLIGDSGEYISCFGPEIFDYEVQEAYLVEEESGVLYQDYIVENGQLFFKDIPKGIYFTFHVLLKGYEEASTKVILSSQNMVDNIHSFSWSMIQRDANPAYPTTFYVADESNSSVLHVDYMSNVRLWVQWPYDQVWFGEYLTDEAGRFEYGICLSENQQVKVKILDPYNNGVDYECEITLFVPVIGEASNSDIIFLNKDGTCKVISNEEYFMR